MKRYFVKIITCLFVWCLFLQPRCYGSHAAGGELIFRHIPGTSDSTYEFTFKFYRDCAGIAAPPVVSVCYRNTCDLTQGYTANLFASLYLPDSSINGHEINPDCPGYPTSCFDLNSTIPGYQEWWYTGSITLPSRCNHWIFSIQIDGRNLGITNILPVPAIPIFPMYLETTLNNEDGQGSSSPYFTTRPVPYVCLNEADDYNNGAVDPDGDSLVFSLTHSLSGTSDCPALVDSSQFVSPIYNLTNNPLSCNNTFQLNSMTGQMSYTPDIQQRAVISLLTKKYRNGILLSTVMRDVETVVLPCTNPAPNFILDSTHVTGGSDSEGVIYTCSGDNLHVCFKLIDPLSDATLVATDNTDSAASGSHITYSGIGTDSIEGCIDWTPALQQAGFHVIVITAYDSTCRFPGLQVEHSFSIPIRVYPTLQAYGDTTLCAGDSTNIHVVGGNAFSWNVVAGDMNSLSCENCTEQWVRPKWTTTYAVKNNYFNSIACKTTDTITVAVVHMPGIDTTINKCKNDTIQLPINLYGNNPANYHFMWHPAYFLDHDTAINPLCWSPSDQDYVPYISVNTGITCSLIDTVRVRVVNHFLHAVDTGMCPGDTITIYASGAATYQWKLDDKTYISDTNATAPKVSPPTDWSYIVYGANGHGCLDTAAAHVRVYPNAIVNLPDSVVLYYGESYPFSPQTNCITFIWFPPLGLNADDISNPVANPPVDTKYIVTGKTEEGCTVTSSVNVYRSDEVILTLPNAFTPGNGPNNLLKPIYKGNVTLDHLRIFNRWGQVVYESTNLDEGWDGTWHGAPQPPGVFIYTMQGHTNTGRILNKQGNITLLR